jgi:hypothetical protein
LEFPHAFPTSLTPIQIPKRALSDVMEEDGRGERLLVKRETWSIRERTVDWKGFTRLASVVAPPDAKL